MSEYAPSIGIDFGTTNSSVAWRDPRTGEANVILNAEGQAKTPTLVHFGEGETLVGEPVQNLLQDVSTDKTRREEVFRRTITSIKRNLLSPPRIALPGGRYVRPVDIASEVLKKIKADVEDGHFHEPISRAVITCPAEFNVLQRRKIEEAGRQAGFGEVVLLEEPVAGALAYSRAGLDVGEHVLVYDLGGGTFDLAVLNNEGESFHVAMEPKGMERCGGEDFDLALYHHCDEVVREGFGRPISLNGAVDLSFLGACRRRKESLTFQKRERFNHYLASTNGPVHFEHEVDRSTFEDLIGDYVETTARLTKEILTQATAAGHEVDTVALIGGSVRVPLVGKTLRETLPVPPLGFDRRDVAVALGAAHFTEVVFGNGSITAKPKPEPKVEPPNWVSRYENALAEVRDKRLTRREVDRLGKLAEEFGATAEGARNIEVRVLGDSREALLAREYRRAVGMVWKDEELNAEEVSWLDHLSRELGLDRIEVSRIEREVFGATREDVLSRQTPADAADETRGDFVLTHTLTGHTGEVSAVALSPDAAFLVSGASDRTVRGWNARTGESVGSLTGHAGAVRDVSFGHDGHLLASGGSDGAVMSWELPHGAPGRSFGGAGWILAVELDSRSGLLASAGTDGVVSVHSLRGEERPRILSGHTHWILALALTERRIFSASADGTVRGWNIESGETDCVLEHPGWVHSVAVDEGGRLLASGCEDGHVRIWDARDGKMIHAVQAHSGPVNCVDFGPEGLVFSGGEDGRIKVWDSLTALPLGVLSGHRSGVTSLSVSESGLLASGGNDGNVKVWRNVRDTSVPVRAEPRIEPGRPPDLPI